MIAEMSLVDVMQSVHYSCDVGRLGDPTEWLAMIANKVADPVTPALIDEIMINGFQDPITLNPCNSGGYHLGNGHHRLSVMILLGADMIKVEVTHDTIFSPNSCNHSRDTYANPNYGNGDHVWLADQVRIDADGEPIYLPHPFADVPSCLYRPDYDSDSDGQCPCSGCRPSESSSDHSATERYGTMIQVGPNLTIFVDDPRAMIHTREVFVAVEIPDQLALIPA